jgi:hypothetical protein
MDKKLSPNKKKIVEKELNRILKDRPVYNPDKIKKSECMNFFHYKIGKNMKEYELGRWTSRQQAIAVSYSETTQIYPKCNKYLSKKSSDKRRSKKK